MDDSWAFRTTRGHAVVSDGQLRIEQSFSGLLRGPVQEKWKSGDAKQRALFLFSLFGIASSLARVAPVVGALFGPSEVTWIQWFVFACFVAATIAVVLGVFRTKTFPLDSIDAFGRDDTTLKLFHEEDGEREVHELELPSETDVADAAEMLRLKGVSANRDSARTRADEKREKRDYESVRTRLSETNR